MMKPGLATMFDINASSVLGNNAYPLHLSWGILHNVVQLIYATTQRKVEAIQA